MFEIIWAYKLSKIKLVFPMVSFLNNQDLKL